MDGSNIDEGKRFAKAFRFMGEAYSEVVSPLKTEAYFMVLEPYPIEMVEKAILQTCREVQAFKVPPASEIVNRIEGTLGERAENAFAICIRHSILDNSVEFEDSAISVAIERTAGSWEQWCDWVRFMPDEEFQWKKKDWLKHYQQNRNAPGEPKQFMGYLEQVQQIRGDNTFGPVFCRVALDGSVQKEAKRIAVKPSLQQLSDGGSFASPEEIAEILKEAKDLGDSKSLLKEKEKT